MSDIKKHIMLFALIVIMSFLSINAVAIGAEVFGDSIKVTQGEIFDVPIKIKNNPGIMGFKINVTCPNELMALSVKRSSLTENGFLNDSITAENKSSFDVVWSNSENIGEEGVLFFLEFKAEKTGLANLKLDFSSDDTFNENWESVVLECTDVTIDIKTADAETSEQQQSKLSLPTESAKSTDVLKDKFVEDMLMKVDSADIISAIQDGLCKFKVNDINDLSTNEKSEFVSVVENKLLENATDIGKLSEAEVSVDEAIVIIEQLDEAAKEYATQGVIIESATNVDNLTEIKEKHIDAKKMIVFCSIVLLIMAITLCLAFNHKKIKHEEDSKCKEK